MNRIDNHKEVKVNLQEKLLSAVDNYLQNHSRALVVPFDINYPNNEMEYSSDNKNFSKCMQKVIQKINRRYDKGNIDPKYVAVREQNTSQNPHYHVCVLLNGHQTQSAYKVLQATEEMRASTLNLDKDEGRGLVHCSKRTIDDMPDYTGFMIHRNEPLPVDVENRINYMAKPQTKDTKPQGVREIFMSRLSKDKSSKEIKNV